MMHNWCMIIPPWPLALGEVLNDCKKTMSLQTHYNENPRTLELTQSWQNMQPIVKVNSALQRYHAQPFIYTLNLPILSKDPADDFLFNSKRGFCEHYATSFVYLMRAAGVPARIVTGYQGSELNPNGNYLIVRQSDAHAWAEVWLENRGWVRVDPPPPRRPSASSKAFLKQLVRPTCCLWWRVQIFRCLEKHF